MEKGQLGDEEEPTDNQQDDGMESENWLLTDENLVIIPMDTIGIHIEPVTLLTCAPDGRYGTRFTRGMVFQAASQGNTSQLHGLLNYLCVNHKQLTDPEFTDEVTGKTALLKALMHLKDGQNGTVELFLDIAEKTGDLEKLINASYKDIFYHGQTALHVAIERRSFDHVKLLVEKGADVQAKANGRFFLRNEELGFYFGELPLSLAACTNQPTIVTFLMDNPYRRADVTDRDSEGNTVLHTLVVIVDNSAENTEMFAKIYDQILTQYNRLESPKKIKLEDIENNQGLTPLKLAAKLGKIGLFKHILTREFVDKDMRPLSRKITQWVYGPVHSSLYDTSSIDTNEDNSVLDIVVFRSNTPNRPQMLLIEPLCTLLNYKWERFASKLFLMNFLVYLLYLIIFTLVAGFRKEGQPPFPIENVTVDSFRLVGELISLLGALWFLYKVINGFRRNPPTFRSLYTDRIYDLLFLLQAVLLLISAALYFGGRKEYVGLLVLSLSLAWINVLYYSRGSKQMGIYSVMMKRMIVGDLLTFLCVYFVLLVGFSAAMVALMYDNIPAHLRPSNESLPSPDVGTAPYNKPTYSDFRFTILELFKFTIGMGNLEFTDDVQNMGVFYILLISYIVLTYILLLNMLIALMGNTVERISKENEDIWNLQKASTILNMERSLPQRLKEKLFFKESIMVYFKLHEDDESRRYLRVEEMDWRQWRSDLGAYPEDDPENQLVNALEHQPKHRSPWEIIRQRHRNLHQKNVT